MNLNIDPVKFNSSTQKSSKISNFYTTLYFFILCFAYYFSISWLFYIYAGLAYLSLVFAPLAIVFTIYMTYTRNSALINLDRFPFSIFNLLGYASIYLTYLHSQEINSSFIYYAVVVSLISSVSVLITMMYRDTVADKMRKEINK